MPSHALAGASIVIDTHTLIWALLERVRLSAAADAAFQAAELAGAPIYVCTITFVELRYLVEKGKIRGNVYQECWDKLNDPATVLAPEPLDLVIADRLTQIPRATVPDMPDRIIAATALTLGLPLITRDSNIRALTNITTIW